MGKDETPNFLQHSRYAKQCRRTRDMIEITQPCERKVPPTAL